MVGPVVRPHDDPKVLVCFFRPSLQVDAVRGPMLVVRANDRHLMPSARFTRIAWLTWRVAIQVPVADHVIVVRAGSEQADVTDASLVLVVSALDPPPAAIVVPALTRRPTTTVAEMRCPFMSMLL